MQIAGCRTQVTGYKGQVEGGKRQDVTCLLRSAPCILRPLLILILSIAAFYYLSDMLMAQIHCYQAKNFFLDENYFMATEHLKKAEKYQPHDYQIKKELGEAYSKWGESNSNIRDAMILIQRSNDFYSEAFRLNPSDAETAYSVARGEERLETLYQQLYPDKKETPYHPLPYFREAVRLRPNGISYHYALARYLYKQEDEKAFHETIQRLVRIYPNVYYYLKREEFWSPVVRDVCKQGLEAAVEKRPSLREAHLILSSFMAEDKAWRTAISHYKKALQEKSFQNNSANYIYLGSLYLKDGQLENAQICFFHGMKTSSSREKDLARIYTFYRNESQSEKFCQFYPKIKQHFILSYQTDILFARALIDLKKYQEAKDVLNQFNQRSPDAEAYYWLARIAELEQDWDSMELAIQKATVFDPKNRTYHRVFSNILRRLKKHDRANEEARLATQK